MAAAVMLAAGCAGTAGSGPGAEAVWSRPVATAAPGDAGLALEIHNEVAALGPLVGVAAVLDGAIVFRDTAWQAGQRRALALSTTGGRHHLCVVAHYRGASDDRAFIVRAPRLLDLVPGSAVAVRVSLQEHLGAEPYATAQYTGGATYAAAAGAPDIEKYESRLDELCAGR
jgi:hypothetical protein